MESSCCGAPPWLMIWYEYVGINYGICESCREHCEFHDEDEEEDEYILELQSKLEMVLACKENHCEYCKKEIRDLLKIKKKQKEKSNG